MDFGKLPRERVDQVDFFLPDFSAWNDRVLPGLPTPTRFYLGLPRWSAREFVGRLYPQGTRSTGFAAAYAARFNTIEFNSSHYRLYRPEEVEQLLQKIHAPEFRFCPKFYNEISHQGSLDDKAGLTEAFLQSLRAFGSQLGPSFLQLSERFSPARSQELFRYLHLLPKDLCFFLELRHPGWMDYPVFDDLALTLRSLNMGLVITDTAGRRDVCHMHLTTDVALIRFAANGLHPTDYTRMDDWIRILGDWKSKGLREAYFLLHAGGDDSLAPDLARYFVDKANSELDAGLPTVDLPGMIPGW